MQQMYKPLSNRPEVYRPRDVVVARTVDVDKRLTEQLDRKKRNGIHQREKIHDRARERDEAELNGLEELEEGEWGAKREPNRPIKSEVARMRRIIERGDTLSPSEVDRIADIPEARDLVRINQERIEPKGGFTLSPMKLLLRSL